MATTTRTACPHEVRETVLTLANWGHLYADHTKPLLLNLAHRIDRGTFDAAKAVKGFRNIVETGMRNSEWNVVYGTWRPSVASRNQAAAEMFDSYKEELTELAYESIGAEFLAVDVCDWGHDGSGNPTARHHVYTSTSDGGRVRLLSDRKCRRQQVGYGDRFDSCPDALRKVGINPAWYEFTGQTGGRSDDSLIANYRRRMVTI